MCVFFEEIKKKLVGTLKILHYILYSKCFIKVSNIFSFDGLEVELSNVISAAKLT